MSKYLFVSFEQQEPITENIFNQDIIKYVIYQLEKCPTTGRLHWQGYIETIKECPWTRLKRLMGNTIHFEVCNNPMAVLMYSKKCPTRVKGPFTWSILGKTHFTDTMGARLCRAHEEARKQITK